MANVKIRFSIEVDNESFVEHSAEYQSTYSMRHPLETNEEKLAVDVINQINKLATANKLKQKNWDSLFGEAVLKNGIRVSQCE